MPLEDDSRYSCTDIATLKGLGPSYIKSFNNKGIKTLFDILFDFPFKYLDKTKVTKIRDIFPDGNFVLIDAHIVAVHNVLNSRVRLLKVILQDDTGKIEATFFNLYPNQIRNYVQGRRVLAFGSVKLSEYSGARVMAQPTVTFIGDNDPFLPSDRLTPVYHAVEKVPQASIRKIIFGVLDSLKVMSLPEILPSELNPFKLTIS